MKLNNRKLQWSAATVLLCLVMVVASWFLLISPRRATADDLNAQVAVGRSDNDELRARIEQLRAQFADLPASRTKLAKIQQQIPATLDMPGLLRSVDTLAARAGVDLTNVSAASAQPVTAASSAAGSAPGRSSGSGATGGGSGPGNGVYGTPLVLTFTGTYFQAVTFVRQLQTGMPRTYLIKSLQISQGVGAGGVPGVSVSLTGVVFTRPAAAPGPGASPGSGAAAGSGAAGSGATGSGAGSGSSAPPAAGTKVTNALGSDGREVSPW